MWKPQNEPEKLQGIPIGIPSKKLKAQSNSQGGGSYNESTGLQNTNVSLAKSEPSGPLKKPTLGPFMRAKIGSEMVKLQPHGGDSGSANQRGLGGPGTFLEQTNYLNVPDFSSPRRPIEISQNFSEILDQHDTSNWQSFVKDFPELK